MTIKAHGSDEIVRLHQRDANPVNMDVQGECFVVLVAPAGAIVVLRTVDIYDCCQTLL